MSVILVNIINHLTIKLLVKSIHFHPISLFFHRQAQIIQVFTNTRNFFPSSKEINLMVFSLLQECFLRKINKGSNYYKSKASATQLTVDSWLHEHVIIFSYVTWRNYFNYQRLPNIRCPQNFIVRAWRRAYFFPLQSLCEILHELEV